MSITMKWKLVSCLVLLTCVLQSGLPALAEAGTTAVSGTVPLVAYDVFVSDISYYSAIIHWKTNGNAGSQVSYDTSYHDNIEDYAYCTGEDSSPVPEHMVTLTALSPDTTYHFRVRSRIIPGTDFIAVSNDYNFTTLALPPPTSIVITITNPANGSTTNNSYVNVTATLDAAGTARYLNWQGLNYTMTPTTAQPAGTVFFRNMTGLLSGNYSFKVYANDTGVLTNVSETRVVTVNRTIADTTIGSFINTTTFLVNTTINITSPSGNVTVTIPEGTNASVGGAALTTISIDSLVTVNSTFVAALGSSDRLVGESLSLGPKDARFSPDIQIRFNYTAAMLTAAGISASELRVKFYNTSTNTWDVQTPYTLNETGKYIIANVSHFSTFALIGTVTTTTTTTTTGGGGGVVTSEPYTNIEKSERYDKSLIANTPVTYTFKAPELGVYEIAVTGKENENDVALRVEVLKGTSKLVTVQAPGIVYKNVNIWAGTKRIKEVLIRFKVENSWLGSNSLAGSDIKMVRWDGSQWAQLETAEKTRDDTYTYYEAKTDTFSVFAITGLKGGVIVPTATPAGVVTETPAKTATPAPAPTKRVPGFELVLVAAALCSVYLFGRMRR